MRRFSRADEPAICKSPSARWNGQWVARRDENPKAGFSWYEFNGKTAREHLLPALYDQSQGHCCFCDAFPVGGVSNDSIEHFRPKSTFPHLAYTWSNLYYCCDACQNAKGEKWDEQLLHADAPEYSFSHYFEFDFTTGEIRPNTLAGEADRQRAAVTILLYGLDLQSRRRYRLSEARKYSLCEAGSRSDEVWAHRDLLGIE